MDKQLLDILYTTRWNIKHDKFDDAEMTITQAIDHLTGRTPIIEPVPGLKPPPSVIDVPVKVGELWYPNAVKRTDLRMKARGTFKGGWPVGILVHFTAGRSGGLAKAIDSIKGGIKNGYLFACIADSGEFVQPNPMTEWGYHAGESSWSKYSKLFSGTVSDEMFGIEMNNAGMVKLVESGKYKGMYETWFGTYLQESEVRYVTQAEYGCPTGYYHKYTPEQEKSLIEFCVWAIKADPTGRLTADTVLGHHEVAGFKGIGRWRKNDPGGALSMSMDDFRKLIGRLTV